MFTDADNSFAVSVISFPDFVAFARLFIELLIFTKEFPFDSLSAI